MHNYWPIIVLNIRYQNGQMTETAVSWRKAIDGDIANRIQYEELINGRRNTFINAIFVDREKLK